ncbi:MAG TPA: carboxymuconolactone decarboxylase family protein [Streptosporangiaceae bacterium]|nr:carboxymuconolactone decarboxylase family protein [Streptosporangiaceae bacterium]
MINRSAQPNIYEMVISRTPTPPDTPLRFAARDVLFGQVWSRPGLTMRQRRWISLTGAALGGPGIGAESHVYGALRSRDISVTELREFVLHLAPLVGWPRVAWLDGLIGTTVRDLDDAVGPESTETAEPLPVPSLTEFASSHSGTPLQTLLGDAVQYGIIWSRPALPGCDRRLISIVALAVERAADLVAGHVAAALDAQELDMTALRELALHTGFYAGLPAARLIDDAVTDAAPRGYDS